MKSTLSNSVNAKMKTPSHQRPLQLTPQKPEEKTLTRGQQLADTLAAKVGSWPFLIGQTVILAGWVGANLTPGIPHWDQQPFILLNLVFSFASAYTAPIVLMSQNRQSDAEREQNLYNHQVNLKAAHDVVLLHEKLDRLSHHIPDLMEKLNQQQQSVSPIKEMVMPAPVKAITEGNEAAKPSVSDQKQKAEVPILLPQVFKSNFYSSKYAEVMPISLPTQKPSTHSVSALSYFKL
ncbi:DUF1003 domain-containing protein [Microcoleus sp. K5-D4]|uniref:DUF1003 domain-containing protein n=1 Tax=Microcoleus sp. K5-D4 TaxID=2818801 RepID=UPI002FD1DE59